MPSGNEEAEIKPLTLVSASDYDCDLLATEELEETSFTKSKVSYQKLQQDAWLKHQGRAVGGTATGLAGLRVTTQRKEAQGERGKEETRQHYHRHLQTTVYQRHPRASAEN